MLGDLLNSRIGIVTVRNAGCASDAITTHRKAKFSQGEKWDLGDVWEVWDGKTITVPCLTPESCLVETPRHRRYHPFDLADPHHHPSENTMLLNRTSYLIKERVAFMKLTDRYDIFDPETNEELGFAVEKISTFAKLLRLVVNKQLLPTTVVIQESEESDPVVKITRGMTFLRSKVSVFDENDKEVGFFRSKLFSLGGGFTVHEPGGTQIADVKGNWKGWDFKITDMQGKELGTVNKKWAGAMKEIFTSADNYLIKLDDSISTNPGLAALLLAAGLAIDIVFKETGN